MAKNVHVGTLVSMCITDILIKNSCFLSCGSVMEYEKKTLCQRDKEVNIVIVDDKKNGYAL